MRDDLYLSGKKYISARRASELTGYTSDYVGQLCRIGKVDATMVGRGWFISQESILLHKENLSSLGTRGNSKNISSEILSEYSQKFPDTLPVYVFGLRLSKNEHLFCTKNKKDYKII